MEEATTAGDAGTSTPQFQVDPFWPKPLPNDWLIGRIAGMAVDSRDRIFVVQRPGSLTRDELGLTQDPPMSLCCRPAPPVLVFDAEGNLLDSWGGPGEGYDGPAPSTASTSTTTTTSGWAARASATRRRCWTTANTGKATRGAETTSC